MWSVRGPSRLPASTVSAGGVNISEGTLSVATEAALGGSNGATGANNGLIEFTGAGSFSPSGANLNIGQTGGTILGYRKIQIDQGATATFNVGSAANSMSIVSTISGPGQLIKAGAGTLTILGNQKTYSGGTVLNAGILHLSNSASPTSNVLPGAGDITVNGGTLDIGSTATVQTSQTTSGIILVTGGSLANGTLITTNAAGFQMSGGYEGASAIIAGDAPLVFRPESGTITLRGSNTYTGGTILQGGTVNINGDWNFGDVTGKIMFTGDARIQPSAANQYDTFDVNRVVTIADGVQGAFATNNFDQNLGILITDAADHVDGMPGGILTKTGGGTLVLGGSFDSLKYTGGTQLLAGVLRLKSWISPLNPSGSVMISGGTLDLGAGEDPSGQFSGRTIVNNIVSFRGGLTGSGGFFVSAPGYYDAQSGSALATLDGPVPLVKSGVTVMYLMPTTKVNSYTGGTTVTAGTLNVNADGAMGPGTTPLVFTGSSTLQNGVPMDPTVDSNNTIISGVSELATSRPITLSGTQLLVTGTHSETVVTDTGIDTIVVTDTAARPAVITFDDNSAALSTLNKVPVTGLITINSGITGTGGLRKVGTGTLTCLPRPIPIAAARPLPQACCSPGAATTVWRRRRVASSLAAARSIWAATARTSPVRASSPSPAACSATAP